MDCGLSEIEGVVVREFGVFVRCNSLRFLPLLVLDRLIQCVRIQDFSQEIRCYGVTVYGVNNCFVICVGIPARVIYGLMN